MKKSAFTLIELVFVIVVLGILSAIALPKFLGVSKQAHKASLEVFTGTLNRTVGPTLWGESLSKNYYGSIKKLNLDANKLKTYIDIPKEINASDINLSHCNSSGGVVMEINSSVAGFDGNITCIDGNATQSPRFTLNIN